MISLFLMCQDRLEQVVELSILMLLNIYNVTTWRGNGQARSRYGEETKNGQEMEMEWKQNLRGMEREWTKNGEQMAKKTKMESEWTK